MAAFPVRSSCRKTCTTDPTAEPATGPNERPHAPANGHTPQRTARSAKGATYRSPGHRPGTTRHEKPGALKGRPNSDHVLAAPSSIPHIPFIEWHLMLLQKLTVFLLKRLHAVMLLLIADVVRHLRHVGFAHRERSVARLPRKGGQC